MAICVLAFCTPPSFAEDKEATSKYGTPQQPAWVGNTDSLDFPKPNPEKVFADQKVFQPDGSPYRAAQEDWEGARRRIAQSPEWKKWIADTQAKADRWMARNHDHTEWEAGWSHDFVDPKDGSYLVWTENVPGEEVKFLTGKSGDHVEITPKLFRAWVGTFRKNHAEMMIEAARLYRLTGDVHYAEWAAGQLDFYAKNYQAWGKGVAKINRSWLGCQSLDDAVIVARHGEAARLLFDWASPERRQLWFDQLFKPEAELLGYTYQAIHNIALWQRATQAQIALLYKDDELWKKAMEGPVGFRAQIRKGVTSDYFWYEQSMSYNGFVMTAVMPLFTFAGLVGEADQLRHEAAVTENLMLSTLWIRFPDGSVPNPADGSGMPHAPSSLLGEAYRIMPTHLGLAAADKRFSWNTLVDPPASDHVETKLPEVVSRNMESTRFALLKRGPWQVFLHYGQLRKSHSQAEALNWSASFEGTDITHDAGTVGYGSPLASNYYRTGLTHNVPLVNGEGQEPWSPGKLLQFDADNAVMSAEQPLYRADASARRTLRIENNTLVDEATVTANAPAKLGLALHLQGQPRLGEAFKEANDFAAGRPKAFEYWTQVKRATYRDKAEIQVEFPGGKWMNVTFAVPGEFTLWEGSSPDIPPKRRAGFYLETLGQSATFTTTIAPAGAKKAGFRSLR
ncbi:MAG: heparinase II/III family protein [Chthoniobacteraceae bacterium]